MTPPPACWCCGEPCRTVWALNMHDVVRVPWSHIQATNLPKDPLITWLCSRCVDAAAEGR